jgi:ABC-type branched-subunit amino acid transport system ATPase component
MLPGHVHSEEPEMTMITRTLARVAVVAVGAVAAAGTYTEIRRAPDQS